MNSLTTRLPGIVLLNLVVLSANADVRLPKLISNHMVLQRNKLVNVWGEASPGEAVAVTFRGKSYTTTANTRGRWQVALAPSAAGGPFNLKIKGKNEIVIKDVLVGEVWICSGQSNMAWPVTRAIHPKKEIAAAKHPSIRLFTVQRSAQATPQTRLTGARQSTWKKCSPQSIPRFSAVAYFFGRKLNKDLSVPVGLINTSWGGTRAEAWTRREALTQTDTLNALVKHWDEVDANWDPEAAQARYDRQLERYKKLLAASKKKGKKKRRRIRPPQRPVHPNRNRHHISTLYNGMIAPLLPYAIRGAIWYQGEANVGRAEQYGTLFPTMIRNWRSDWKQGDFPFLFVQLAPFRYRRHPQAACAELWEAQAHTLSLPHTGMVVTTDIGNIRDIHPRNKQEVGRRLALLALAGTYQKKLVARGPVFQSQKIEGNRIRLKFSGIGSGLASRDGKPLTHFTICGADKKFHPATATIEGNAILVASDSVAKPIAVRFGWQDTATPNLMNQEGLPASPFRTDRFKRVTAGKLTP